MVKTKLEKAKTNIAKYLLHLDQDIFRKKDLQSIFTYNQEDWNLSNSITVKSFISFLIKEEVIKEVKLDFPHRNELRYILRDVSIYNFVLSLKPNSYFTHYTAMYLNGITEQIPKTIYLNFEQPKKRYRDLDLNQERINLAFKRPVRTTNNIANYGDYRIIILNGMYTGKLGVVAEHQEDRGNLIYTNIERTLIDITVRPQHAGGVFEVLKAFELAQDKLSINRLAAMLKQLNYVYPYHQAIGFYLERSGAYKENMINLLNKFDIKFDFYLVHGMKEMEYSKRWRLYYPKGL